MKLALAVLVLAIPGFGWRLDGCEKESGGGSTGGQVHAKVIAGKGKFATITFFPGNRQPKMEPSALAPPRKVLSRDLRVGSGKAAHRGDRLNLYYYSVDYKTGKRTYFRWPPQHPLTIRLGNEHWERPLAGMRVGGQREVVVPSDLLFKTGTVDYLFELRRVGGGSGETSGR